MFDAGCGGRTLDVGKGAQVDALLVGRGHRDRWRIGGGVVFDAK